MKYAFLTGGLLLMLAGCSGDDVAQEPGQQVASNQGANTEQANNAVEEQDAATDEVEEIEEVETHPDDVEWDVAQWDVDEQETYEWLEEDVDVADAVATTTDYPLEELQALLQRVDEKLHMHDALHSFVIHKMLETDVNNGSTTQVMMDTAFIMDGAATTDYGGSRARYLQSIQAREYGIEREGYYSRQDEHYYEHSNETDRWTGYYVEQPFMYFTPLKVLALLEPYMETSYTEVNGDVVTVGIFLDPVADAALIKELTTYAIETQIPYVGERKQLLNEEADSMYQSMTVLLNFNQTTNTLTEFVYELKAGYTEFEEQTPLWESTMVQQFDYEANVPLQNLQVTDEILAEAFAG